MKMNIFSGKEAGTDRMFINELIVDARECDPVESNIRCLLEKLTRKIGADCWSFSIANISKEKQSIDELFQVHSYPEEWMDRYHNDGLIMNDPVVWRNISTDTVGDLQLWSDTYMTVSNNAQKQFIKKSMDWGCFKNGYSVGHVTFNKDLEISLLSIAGANIKRDARSAIILNSAIDSLHYLIRKSRDRGNIDHITQQQILILDFLQNGLNVDEIAILLGVQKADVDAEISIILKELKSSTLAQAVGKGISAGFIGMV